MEFEIRRGTSHDEAWIGPLLRTGTAAGHFGPTVAQQAPQLIKVAAAGASFAMVKLRNGKQDVRSVSAEISVAEYMGAPVSFLIMLHDSSEHEAHLAGTVAGFQRQGAFSALLKNALETTATGEQILARCYSESVVAQSILLKNGFVVRSHGNPTELVWTCT